MGITHHVSTDRFTVSDLVRMGAELSLGVKPVDVSPRSMETPIYSGRLLAHEVQPGLTATAFDVTYLSDQAFVVEMKAALVCGILLGGDPDWLEIGSSGRVIPRLEQPVLYGFGETMRCRRTCVAQRHCRMAGFILKPDFFDRFGDDIADDGLAVLREFVGAEFRTEALARSPRLVEIASRSLDHPYNGQLGQLFLESNTLSYVVEVAELLKQERRLVVQIGRRHYDRVIEARDILDADLIAPPRTLELARRVGVNVTTLQANFKAVFGTTIFGYVRDQRLLMARVLLLDHGLTVAEVGYRVGFASPAAFTAAYRRHFGHPPGKEAARDPA
jgi:AraC-like DNA-binding protein